MSKECQRCGFQNDDEHFFCQQCGEPLDSNVRVIMGYEKMKKSASPAPKTAPKKDDDDFVFVKREKKKKSYAAVWAALAGIVIVVGAAAYFLLR